MCGKVIGKFSGKCLAHCVLGFVELRVYSGGWLNCPGASGTGCDGTCGLENVRGIKQNITKTDKENTNKILSYKVHTELAIDNVR